MHQPPPSSTQLHPAPFTFTQPISVSTQLHSPQSSSFQSPLSSLQYSQRYQNQNIARNWAISPNLGWKIQRRPFWLKMGTHGILEVLIPNQGLDFWNSDPKIHFWANLGRKSQSCYFCLKIGTNGISRMLVDSYSNISFLNFQPKSWGKFGPKKSKSSVLPEKWHTWYLEDADSYSDISFLNFKT